MKKFFFEKPKKLAVKPATYLQLKRVREGDKRKTAKEQARIAFNGKAFWIDHYAGPVGYSTVGFLSKNLDKVPEQFTNMLLCSNDSAVCALTGISTGVGDPLGLFNILDVKETVQTKHKDSPAKPGKKVRKSKRVSKKNKGKATIGSQFRKALNSLANTIRKTQPHYVRGVRARGVRARSARISIISLTLLTHFIALRKHSNIKYHSLHSHTLLHYENTQTSTHEHRYDAFNRTI